MHHMDATVGRFGSRAEAEMARELLDGAGIPARVRADDVGALHPELGQVGSHSGITLVVPDEHAVEAQEFLDAYAGPTTVAASSSADADTHARSSADDAAAGEGRRGVRVVAALVVVMLVVGVIVAYAADVVAGLG